MPSNHSPVPRFTAREKFAAVALVITSALLAALAQAPAKYASDTFTVITRSDRGTVKTQIEGRGDHCWAATSGDHTAAIAMGDHLCSARGLDVPDDVGIVARISPQKISFRLNGKSYSVTDPAIIKSARSVFDPLVSIQAQQSDLGAQQRALGQEQRVLGLQQSEVKVKVPDMSADFKRIEADAQRLSSHGGTQSELGDLQSEIADLQSRISDLQSSAGDAESKLGDRQSMLGDQRSRLGDQQSALEDKAEALVLPIAGHLREILEQAIRSGAAKAE